MWGLLCLVPQGAPHSVWKIFLGHIQDLCCCNLLTDKLESQNSDLFCPRLGKGKLHLIKPVLKKGILSNLYCSGALNPAGGLVHHRFVSGNHIACLSNTQIGIWVAIISVRQAVKEYRFHSSE